MLMTTSLACCLNLKTLFTYSELVNLSGLNSISLTGKLPWGLRRLLNLRVCGLLQHFLREVSLTNAAI